MIGRDRMRDVLQQHGLAGARRRDDQRALAFADRRDDVDDAGGEVLLGRILVLHAQPLVGIERRQVVEIDLVARLLRVFEIDRVDLEQREVALAFFRRADMAFDGVAGAQAEAADLRGRDVDVVRARQIVRFRRAQEAEAVGEHFDDAFADDVDFAIGELLEDREHQLLLAHGAGVLDLLLFGEGQEFDGGFGFQVLEFHFPHRGLVLGEGPAVPGKESRRTEAGWMRRESQVLGRESEAPGPDACAFRIRGPALDCIRLRSGGYDKIWKCLTFRKGGAGGSRPLLKSERLHDHQDHDQDHQDSRYLVDQAIEFLDCADCGPGRNP